MTAPSCVRRIRVALDDVVRAPEDEGTRPEEIGERVALDDVAIGVEQDDPVVHAGHAVAVDRAVCRDAEEDAVVRARHRVVLDPDVIGLEDQDSVVGGAGAVVGYEREAPHAVARGISSSTTPLVKLRTVPFLIVTPSWPAELSIPTAALEVAGDRVTVEIQRDPVRADHQPVARAIGQIRAEGRVGGHRVPATQRLRPGRAPGAGEQTGDEQY